MCCSCLKFVFHHSFPIGDEESRAFWRGPDAPVAAVLHAGREQGELLLMSVLGLGSIPRVLHSAHVAESDLLHQSSECDLGLQM